MAQELTSPPILPARNAEAAITPLAPTKDAQTTTQEEAPSSLRTTRDRASPLNPLLVVNSGKDDPTISVRAAKNTSVKEKFSDVFSVSNECSLVDRTTLDKFSDDISVAARLSRPTSIEFFRQIGASEFILDILSKGHYPKLISHVPKMERKNNGSFYKHHEFAMAEVDKLLASDRIELVTERPHCVLPLHVVVQPKKNRLILDCTALNKFIEVPKIKFDDYKCALNFFQSKGYLICFDFKDGYYHIAIHPKFRKYLGFSVVRGGKKVYAQFKVGFLGLCDLPWLFTKIFRVLVKHWRSHGMLMCLYLDDGWCFNVDKDQLLAQSYHIRSDLFRAGVVWSVKKCVWTPSTKIEWLGMIWDADSITLAITDRRVDKLKSSAKSLLQDRQCSVRTLASLVGQITSLAPVIGDASSLFSRFMQMEIANAISYDSSVSLNDSIVSELKFWLSNVDSLNSRACSIRDPPIEVVLSGDASASGCGSFIEGTDIVAARSFNPEERLAHSTWRELENIHFSLKAFKSYLSNRSVKFRVDNQASVNIIAKGSMRPECHQFALEIFKFCRLNAISLSVQWVPRNLNKQADAISRLPEVLDTDDWGLTDEFYLILNQRWGPFTVDCFANSDNAKCPKFYSMFLVPNSAGIDAFTFNWASEFCLLVPPVAVVGRCLSHLVRCKAKGVLVVPLWKSSFFWPLLSEVFHKYVVDTLIVKGSSVLCLGNNKNSLLGSPQLDSYVIALLIDCTFSGD